MKKQYISPKLEAILLADVLTASDDYELPVVPGQGDDWELPVVPGN